MINEKERIDLLLKHLKVTKNALGKSIGNLNGQIITNIQTGVNKISPNFARRITNIYKHISYDWLLTGEGNIEHTNDKEEVDILQGSDDTEILLRKEVSIYEKYIKLIEEENKHLELKIKELEIEIKMISQNNKNKNK